LSLIDPIRHYGADVQFYEVHENGSPDLKDLGNMISRRTRAVIVIHYFGFPQALHELEGICQHNKIALIEDCSHAFLSKVGDRYVGETGDFGVFSFRKSIPVYEGGALVSNSAYSAQGALNRPDFNLALKVVKRTVDKVVEGTALWSLWSHHGGERKERGRITKGPQAAKETSSLRALSLDDSNLDTKLMRLRISLLSRFLVAHFDFDGIVKRRRANYSFLLHELSTIPGLRPFYPALPEGVVPWTFPCVVARREGIDTTLREKGVPVLTFGERLDPSVSEKRYPTASRFSRNIILLPVHQGLEVAQLKWMAGWLREVCGTSGVEQ
jgi:dTDP-4-amino-4,6-dideoxygalactose transaminase